MMLAVLGASPLTDSRPRLMRVLVVVPMLLQCVYWEGEGEGVVEGTEIDWQGTGWDGVDR